MLELVRDDGYLLSTDPDRIDLDLVHEWLTTDAYWALGRPRDILRRAIEGAVPYGIYRPGDGRQVAFGRNVTDRTLFAYFCDVYVDRTERGRGLGRWLVTAMRDEMLALGVGRLMLCTKDAERLYAELGFQPVDPEVHWMELRAGQRVPTTSTNGRGEDPSVPYS